MVPRIRRLCSPNLPLDVLNANLVPRLLIVIKPLPIRQIYACEPRARICSYRLPLSLKRSLAADHNNNKDGTHIGPEFCEF